MATLVARVAGWFRELLAPEMNPRGGSVANTEWRRERHALAEEALAQLAEIERRRREVAEEAERLSNIEQQVAQRLAALRRDLSQAERGEL